MVRVRWMRAGALLVAAALAAAVVVVPAESVDADESQNGADMVVINPGGGALENGSDGLMIVLNGYDGWEPAFEPRYSVPEDGSDQVYFASTGQWCCGGASPMLNIGGTLYGEAGAAADENATSWDSTEIMSATGAIGRAPAGSDVVDDTVSTGNGSVHITYQITHGGLRYVLDRYVTYRYPNNFYLDRYVVTIPAGNTDMVKLYAGGDAAPGDNDNGVGVGVGPGFGTGDPLNAAYEVNPTSRIFIA